MLPYNRFKENLLSWHPGTPEGEIEVAYNKYKYMMGHDIR